MKATETHSTAAQIVAQHRHDAAKYSKVFDQRKRRVRGLWRRNVGFYAQLTVTDDASGKKTVRRTRLEDADGNPVTTVTEALKGLNKLKVKRTDNTLTLSPKRTPAFAEYAQQYLAHCEALKNNCKP